MDIWIIDAVRGLEPDQENEVDLTELWHHVPSMRHNGALFTPADRVLENIMGSTYEFWYQVRPHRKSVVFGRLSAPLTDHRKSYVSPDRRGRMTFDGRHWTHK